MQAARITELSTKMYSNKTYNQYEILELMEKWYNTEQSKYKANIYRIYKVKRLKPKDIITAMQVGSNTAKSYICAAHPARLEFITALKLAEFLEVDIERFLD